LFGTIFKLLSDKFFMFRLDKAGGAVGILTAFIAYYIAVSELLEAESKPIMVLPRGAF
jgi:hypothetical protein